MPNDIINRQEVLKTLHALLSPGQLFEIRVLKGIKSRDNPRFSSTYSGYFAKPETAAEELKKFQSGEFYVTLNPVDGRLHARAHDRFVADRESVGATKDGEIPQRRWILIDCDPDRPTGIPSTDDEHAAAGRMIDEIRAWLVDLGLPNGIKASSGNGFHLLLRTDLPTDDAGKVKQLLTALSSRFSTEAVKVDESVFNPARICRLYGSKNCKGDETENRRHRMASLSDVPAKPVPYTVEDIDHAISACNGGDHKSSDPNSENAGHRNDITDPHRTDSSSSSRLDVEAYLQSKEIAYRRHEDDDCVKYLLVCPFDESHGDGSDTAIIQYNSGAVVFKCQHDSCNEYGWKDFKEKVGPPEFNDYSHPESASSRTTVSSPISWRDSLHRWVNKFDAGEPPTVYPIGFDMEIGPGLLTLVGGGPGCGKTTFAMQALTTAMLTSRDIRAVYCSVEVPPEALIEKQIAVQAGVDYHNLHYRENLTEDDREEIGKAAGYLAETIGDRLLIANRPFDMTNIEKTAYQHRANLVVLDYIQRIPPSIDTRLDARQSINATLDRARVLCDKGMAVLAISSLSRAGGGYTGNVGLTSFRESGELEYGCDEAFVMVRDENDASMVEFLHVKARYRRPQNFRLCQDDTLRFSLDDFTESPSDVLSSETTKDAELHANASFCLETFLES